MCAVGGLLGGALGRMFGRSRQFMFVNRPYTRDEEVFVVKAGWCPQLTTNIVKFYLFINAHVFISNKN